MSVIDADAHVIETEQTWSFMLEEDRRFAPELLVSTKNSIEFWRIDDRVFPNSNLGLNVPEESRDLTDVAARLAHMDSLGMYCPGSPKRAQYSCREPAARQPRLRRLSDHG